LPEWESESNGFDGLSSLVRDGGFRVSKRWIERKQPMIADNGVFENQPKQIKGSFDIKRVDEEC